jgi:hypothetical protein
MDIITCLPKSEGKNAIMVVLDRVTKYAHFFFFYPPFKYMSKCLHDSWIVCLTFLDLDEKLKQQNAF